MEAIGISLRLVHAYCCSWPQQLLKLDIVVYRVEDGGIDPRIINLSIS